MTTHAVEARGLCWPIFLGAVGAFNLASYFSESSFQLDDLLQGLGFLLAVPRSYLHPIRFRRKVAPNAPPVPWATWLANAGLALLAAGLAVEWL